MKRFLGLGLVLVLLYAILLTAIPASAVTAGPYNYTKGVIQNISNVSNKSLGNGKATYYKASVTSLMHNESNRSNTYNTHVVVGTKNSKFFVYSGETDDKMGYKKMSVHDMVVAFEKENPAWQVVAAVNGDFFNTSTGEPESPMIQQGNMLKPSKLDDMAGRGMVGVDDKTNKVVYHTIGNAYKNAGYGTSMTFKSVYQVQVLGTHKTNAIASYDCALGKAPTATLLSFTTPGYGNGEYEGKTVYVVDLERYRKDTQSHNGKARSSTYYYAYGKITKTITGTKDMKPAAGEVYIAASSTSQAPLLKVGTYVKVQKQLIGDWKNVSEAIGFKQQLVANGKLIFEGSTYSRYHHNNPNATATKNADEIKGYHCSCNPSKSNTLKWTEDIYDYPMAWKQRTAIGFKEDGSCVLMTVAKGSNNYWGATYVELGTQFLALGCTNAFLLDGGGSSTMLIREGNSLNTVFHAEEGSGGEGRVVGNTAIIAVRKDGVALPETDKVLDADSSDSNKKETTKNSEKKTDKKTDKVTEIVTDMATDFTDNGGSETVPVEEGGCGGVLAFPAILATSGIAVVGFSKKRGEKKKK